MSRPLKTIYGSHVLRVVLTVILPCTRSSSQSSSTALSLAVISPHHARNFGSRYFGNRSEKEDSSVNGLCEDEPGLGKGSIFQLLVQPCQRLSKYSS